MYAPPLAGSDREDARCDGFRERMVCNAGGGAGQWPGGKEGGGHGCPQDVCSKKRRAVGAKKDCRRQSHGWRKRGAPKSYYPSLVTSLSVLREQGALGPPSCGGRQRSASLKRTTPLPQRPHASPSPFRPEPPLCRPADAFRPATVSALATTILPSTSFAVRRRPYSHNVRRFRRRAPRPRWRRRGG